jgi:hypothetical protein
MFKEICFFVWDRTPAWIKWPFILIVGPNLTVCVILFFAFIVPWQREAIRAYVEPRAVRRDAEIRHIVDAQKIRDEAIISTLNRLDRHQSIMFEAITRRSPEN